MYHATDEGEVLSITSETGVRQGDPAAIVLYAITVHEVAGGIRARFPQVLIVQLADERHHRVVPTDSLVSVGSE